MEDPRTTDLNWRDPRPSQGEAKRRCECPSGPIPAPRPQPPHDHPLSPAQHRRPTGIAPPPRSRRGHSPARPLPRRLRALPLVLQARRCRRSSASQPKRPIPIAQARAEGCREALRLRTLDRHGGPRRIRRR
jgi:hypothetical protein